MEKKKDRAQAEKRPLPEAFGVSKTRTCGACQAVYYVKDGHNCPARTG